MKTYRYRGHSMSDPAKYRTREEVSKMREERDPIDGLRRLMLEQKIAGEDAIKEVDRDVWRSRRSTRARSAGWSCLRGPRA
jgi:pyruvate dehydrogenase E1 component alpha subunit